MLKKALQLIEIDSKDFDSKDFESNLIYYSFKFYSINVDNKHTYSDFSIKVITSNANSQMYNPSAIMEMRYFM
jgi:hypothetical protein